MFARTALAVVCVIGISVAQRTIVVSGGGAALQSAVDAARAGDTLDVLAGTYDPVTVQKGIAILCRAGVVVDAGFAPVDAIRITGVPAGQTMALRGGSFKGYPIVLRVVGCAGTVILDSVLPIAWNGSDALMIESCPGPVLVRGISVERGMGTGATSQIRGSASVSFSGCPNLPVMTIADSNVSLAWSSVREYDGYPGLIIESGNVSIVGGRIPGGVLPLGLRLPAPGIRLQSGRLTLAGDVVVAANPFTGWVWLASAIDTLGGTIRVGSHVVLSTLSSTVISGPATVIHEPVPSVAASGVPAGATLRMATDADPGSYTVTFVGLPATPFAFTFPFGELWLDPSSPALDAGLVPASGIRSFSVIVPPISPRLPVTLQPLSVTLAGQLVLGAPTRLILN